jgi:hypothetical protein
VQRAGTRERDGNVLCGFENLDGADGMLRRDARQQVEAARWDEIGESARESTCRTGRAHGDGRRAARNK